MAKEEMSKETSGVNKKRRNFLKVLLLGGGTLVAGRVLGPKILDFLYGPPVVKDFKQFNVTETREKFVISTKSGEEIFVMDNEK